MPFFDKLFCTEKLLSKKLFGCGKIQSDRKYFPKNLLKQDTELKFENSHFATGDEISVVKWKDKGEKSVKIA